ncbi:unnamed protein product [Brassicogethes aeneus]|uniref:Uncharacterized protein n=1 Tax=Brassicogethes aeneus TaxID=1431903 RepID=A0A9P0FJ25_BRAAE|nr:unnamed protein product [Brassicogethes aeneus]
MEKGEGNLDEIQEIDNSFKEILNNINEMKKYLSHPEPLTALTNMHLCLNPPKEENKDSDLETTDLEHKMKDYTKMLFDKKPVEEIKYLSKLNSELYKSFNEVQTNTIKYLNNTVKEKNETEKNQPSYDTIMSETLDKYKCFKLQYELDWIENIKTFINFINQLKNTTADYKTTFFQNLKHDIVLTLNKNFESMENGLNVYAKDLENIYMGIHNKLKVIHGLPKNKHLLDKLNEEMKNVEENYQNRVEEILYPLKDNYIKNYNVLLEKLKMGGGFVNSFNVNITLLEGLVDDLERQMNTIVELTEIELNKQNFTENKDTILSETIDFNEYYESTIKKLEILSAEHFDKINNMESNDEKMHEKYQKMWKSDTEKVCSLYAIQYTLKSEGKK